MQESSNVVGISHPNLQTEAHDGEMGRSALCLEPLKGRGELHSGGNRWADTDLVPRHIDGISLALAKTGGGPVRGLQVGPEPTLLIAVDGKIEHTAGTEKKRDWWIEESMHQTLPKYSYHSWFNHSFIFSLFSLLNL